MEKEIFRKGQEFFKKGTRSSFKEGITAFTAGLCCGLLGTGGGTILLFFLGKNRENEEKKRLLATCAAVILPISVFCYGIYLAFGRVEAGAYLANIAGALSGGAVGALLLKKLPAKAVGRIFSAMLILGGGLMLMQNIRRG